MAAPRLPAAAGRFYPADPKQLAAFLDRSFAAAGPEVPTSSVTAVLVPHAGIEFSGELAAKVYQRLERGGYDAVVILGTGHYKAVEGAAIYPGDYATPEGVVPYDESLAKEIAAKTPLIKFDASAHDKEHSIEVQLPFLRRRLGKFKLVAMVMNTQDLEVEKSVGHALAEAVRGKRILLVASSDQSHYPDGSDADKVDLTTLEALKTADPGYFWLANRFLMNRGVPHLEVAYCGEGAVGAVLAAARELGAAQVDVVGHYNSGDVVPEHDYHHVVGYAGAVLSPGEAAKPPLAELSAEEKKQLLAVAHAAAKEFVHTDKFAPPGLSALPRLNLPGAAFVTWRKKGVLRGCIGETAPQSSLIESVARNAVAAASEDGRFQPVTEAELPELSLEVSVLSPARAVAGVDDIHPGDGVALEKDGRSGVFLPQVWDEVKEKDAFLKLLCREKAGLPEGCYKDVATRWKTFSAISIVP